ncbi:MAG: hypothetical protein B6244_00100 [Candidatus Cloacimonetes bacterium 4572_55]|nr:MAG: hypothetical protein B6244_00100 [Candidatus Cloacimonetes bacterium 4572_55]
MTFLQKFPIILIVIFLISTYSLIWSETERSDSNSEYGPPLPNYLGCTSSFCEFRRTHFHGGIDLRTSGEGMPVLAVGDGYIRRIDISAVGYGKLIYLQMLDGRVALYAHLKNFPPDIEVFIHNQQKEKNRYRVAFDLSPTAFPVKKGDVIAFSGSTGAGPPHLHFELREGMDCPINPLTHGRQVPDTRPPVFYRLAFTPMDQRSYVSTSKPIPLSPSSPTDADLIYAVEEPVIIEGTVDVNVHVHDFINLTENIMSPYKLDLYFDNKHLYSACFDRFCQPLTNQSRLQYDLELFCDTGVGFHALYKTRQNKLPFYEEFPGEDGLIRAIDYPPGLHRIKIVAEDAAGNQGVALVPIIIGQPSLFADTKIYQNDAQWHIDFGASISDIEVSLSRTETEGDWQVLTDYWWEVPEKRIGFYSPFAPEQSFFIRVQVIDIWLNPFFPIYEFAEPELPAVSDLKPTDLMMETSVKRNYVQVDVFTDPLGAIKPTAIIKESGRMWHEIDLKMLEPGRFSGRFAPENENPQAVRIESYLVSANGYQVAKTDRIWLCPIQPRIAHSVVFPMELGLSAEIEFYFPTDSVAENFILGLNTTIPDGSASAEMPLFQIEPAYVLFDKSISIIVSAPDFVKNLDKLALYERRGKSYRFVSNERKGRRFTAKTPILGDFVLLSDNDPPRIRSLFPANKKNVYLKKPTFKAWIYDNLSGIHQDDITFYLDEERVFAEYDIDQNFLFYEVRKNLSIGAHSITLEVKDRVGNVAKQVNQFTISSK